MVRVEAVLATVVQSSRLDWPSSSASSPSSSIEEEKFDSKKSASDDDSNSAALQGKFSSDKFCLCAPNASGNGLCTCDLNNEEHIKSLRDGS
mmetsp:Transcript_47741/g.136865  ORF Transcript_47741/g.136865 Transcript_47741/m.136865 type:complete len:92 (+) Transcript_47741:1463-1738(+)